MCSSGQHTNKMEDTLSESEDVCFCVCVCVILMWCVCLCVLCVCVCEQCSCCDVYNIFCVQAKSVTYWYYFCIIMVFIFLNNGSVLRMC
jgi:hypothetical protein